ncbi:MAG: DUF3822 family protein [Bacteroidales bacterium]|nr:DUF3822 family protein [Bacteroidales bacterium]
MFLPDNIDFAESKKYILSIRLTPNGFYFSIHCSSDELIFYQNSVTFRPNSDYLKNIEKLIFDYSFFSYNYKRINVICVEDETTIVPNKFYDKKLERDFLSFNYLNPKLHLASNRLQGLDSRVIWGIEKSVHSFLSRALLNPYFASHLSFLVPTFHKLHNKSTSALFVNFNDDKLIDMIAFSRDKLMLAKTITANSLLEESYYIQKTWEALELNIQSDILLFSGRTDKHSECIDTLKKVVLKTEDLSLKLLSTTKINNEEVPTEIINQLCEL